jgi:hypothetical protein
VVSYLSYFGRLALQPWTLAAAAMKTPVAVETTGAKVSNVDNPIQAECQARVYLPLTQR